nr:hypothetical protein [Tanacetum cinerariifolium]
MLSLDIGDKIEVTHSKIHEMLGVPVGGYSLFDLDERKANHEFVRLRVRQFHPAELKKIRVNDIVSKLVAAQEIDFLFKVNFHTLFTNTTGKADGKLPEGTNHYLGPLTFLIKLVIILNAKRQELELKDHVLGLLDLHGEWTKAEVQDAEGFIGSSETSEKEGAHLSIKDSYPGQGCQTQ